MKEEEEEEEDTVDDAKGTMVPLSGMDSSPRAFVAFFCFVRVLILVVLVVVVAAVLLLLVVVFFFFFVDVVVVFDDNNSDPGGGDGGGDATTGTLFRLSFLAFVNVFFLGFGRIRFLSDATSHPR